MDVQMYIPLICHAVWITNLAKLCLWLRTFPVLIVVVVVEISEVYASPGGAFETKKAIGSQLPAIYRCC